MSATPLIALLVPTVTALLLVRALWWDRAEPPAPVTVLAALALGGGIGLGSYTYAIALYLGDGSRATVLGLDASLLAGAGLLWRRNAVPRPARPRHAAWNARDRALVAVVAAAAVAALAAFAAIAWVNPHGEWDAWAIWNARARFLFRAGSDWRRAFSPEMMQTDYPPLLSGAVAHVWAVARDDSTAAPRAIALVFSVALVMLLGASITYLRDRTQGLLAAACLLGTPILLQRAAWQYADLPLAFFLLATVTLLAAADRADAAADSSAARGAMVLAGGVAGMAALTKNEGALFIIAIAAVRTLAAARARHIDSRHATAFAIGLAPGAALLAYFKLALAPPNYLLVDQHLADYLARVFDPARYATIATVAAAVLLQSLAALAFAGPIAALLLGRSRDPAARQAAVWIGLVIALVALGYAAVYLVTPLELVWQLQHSLDRLLLQLWPSALFALFLGIASPSEWRAREQPTATPVRHPGRRARHA